MSQASAVAAPGVLGPGARGFKPEMDRLRERMRGLGFSYDEIAIEVSRRYPVRPRQAYRLAWGWTLDKLGERTGLSESAIWYWEAGTRQGIYDIRQLLQLTDALKAPRLALLPVILGQPHALGDLLPGRAGLPAGGPGHA